MAKTPHHAQLNVEQLHLISTHEFNRQKNAAKTWQ